MSWSWGDTIDETTDWTDVAFLEIFRVVLLERLQALYSPAYVTANFSGKWFMSAVTAGLDVQGIDFFNDFVPVWNNLCTDTPVQITPGGLFLAQPAWRALSFQPTVQQPGTSGTPERRKPREIGSITAFGATSQEFVANTDFDGNTVADGMVAYSNFLQAGYVPIGTLYKRTGGIWKIENSDTTAKPDLLSNRSSRPNYAETYHNNTYLTAGDYIGWWFFRDVMEAAKIADSVPWTMTAHDVFSGVVQTAFTTTPGCDIGGGGTRDGEMSVVASGMLTTRSHTVKGYFTLLPNGGAATLSTIGTSGSITSASHTVGPVLCSSFSNFCGCRGVPLISYDFTYG